MAAFETTFRHGNPTSIDYTPGADVEAGEVVLLGNTAGITCGIAHAPIANGELGSLYAGGGIYDVINLDNAANYAKVWWDDSAKKVTTTSANAALFGFITSGGAGGANSVARALHWPFV